MDNFDQIKKQIENDIAENTVVLYMKGTPDFPQCGFSGLVVAILNKLNVKFKGINVLEDNNIRESIKKFSDWPTIPQLYIKGEFIGGCDVTKEMYEKGELQDLLKEKEIIEE
ncbi:MAG: Glutaredoxin 4 [Wolbachia endosymbiont of Ctenocephalides orientis wCori]|nr:MAG: Glutaredoxin 4 [Wolbachia endosymbiont of Ctenocephalides orientis wCori]